MKSWFEGILANTEAEEVKNIEY